MAIVAASKFPCGLMHVSNVKLSFRSCSIFFQQCGCGAASLTGVHGETSGRLHSQRLSGRGPSSFSTPSRAPCHLPLALLSFGPTWSFPSRRFSLTVTCASKHEHARRQAVHGLDAEQEQARCQVAHGLNSEQEQARCQVAHGLNSEQEQARRQVAHGLNSEQALAVLAPAVPIRVVAGPGSGKTRVLTHRVAHLIVNEGVSASNILCITFTNRAAKELRERLGTMLEPQRTQFMTVGTFHSVGVQVLRDSIAQRPDLQLNDNLAIFDTSDCERILKAILSEFAAKHKVDKKGLPSVASLAESLSHYKRARMGRYIEEARTGAHPPPGPQESAWARSIMARVSAENLEELRELVFDYGGRVLDVARSYERNLRACNAVDFDDLIHLPLQLLHESKPLLQSYRKKYTHVLVDEFQDTDLAQYELVRLLMEESGNLFVVGDIDQSIYDWRGAKPEYMQLLLQKVFPDVTTFKLQQNYRSSKGIVDAAVGLIEKSEVDRSFGDDGTLRLSPVKPPGMPLAVGCRFNDVEEARQTVEEIGHLVRRGQPLGGMAILYRTRKQSRLFEQELTKEGIPFVVLGGSPFYSRKEVKDLLAYLKVINNPMDSVALDRIINVPPRGIGKATQEKLVAWANQMGCPLGVALLEFGTDLPGKDVVDILPRARAKVMDFCALKDDLAAYSKNHTVGDLVNYIIDRVGYEEYVEKSEKEKEDRERGVKPSQIVDDFVDVAFGMDREAGGDSTLAEFLQNIALVSDTVRPGSEGGKDGKLEAEAVKLTTVHGSKGLEFDAVFLVGMEDGLFPSKSEVASVRAQERRLCYVGMTRARDLLYLSWCKLRSEYGGQPTAAYMSPFVVDLIDASAEVNAPPGARPGWWQYYSGFSTRPRAQARVVSGTKFKVVSSSSEPKPSLKAKPRPQERGRRDPATPHVRKKLPFEKMLGS